MEKNLKYMNLFSYLGSKVNTSESLNDVVVI